MGLLDSVLDPILRSGGDPAQNVPTATLTPQQLGLQNQLLGALSGQIGQPGQVFQGQLPGQSQLQGQAFDFASGLIPQQQQQLQQQLQPFDPQSVLSDFQPASDFAENFFRTRIQPGITGQAGAQGTNLSSSMNRALVQGGTDLSLGLQNQLLPFLAQGREGALNRQQQAIPNAMNFGQGLAGLGGQQRGIGLSQFGEQQRQFEALDPFKNPALNLLPLGLGQQAFENVVYPATPSYFDQFAPVAAAFASGALQAK